MQHLGDITKISGADAPAVDVIIGGSPCQDLSLAGKRAGLVGERSGLFMEQIRIIKEMRKKDESNGRTGINVRPRYMVWENVPGTFSSAKGEDFRAVLEETAKVADENAAVPRPKDGKWTKAGCILADGWSIAWRVLDAQFWGVPQRRARIALVADFAGQSASEILFVRESQAGHTQPGEEKGKGTAGDTAESVGSVGFVMKASGTARSCGCAEEQAPSIGTDGCHYGVVYAIGQGQVNGIGLHETAPALNCMHDTAQVLTYDARGNGDGKTAATMTGDHQDRITDYTSIVISESARDMADDSSVTLKAQDGAHGGPVVCYGICSDASNSMKSDNPHSGIYEAGVSRTIDGNGGNPSCNQGGNVVCVDQGAGKSSCAISKDVAPTLACTHGGEPVIAIAADMRNMAVSDVNGTLQAKSNGGTSLNLNNTCVTTPNYEARRFTPMECERLQGYPDGWTDIGEWVDTKGKKHKDADAPRYKALGNSIALPPWKWVLKRLCAMYERDATMASLFDGIGGFPCIWEQINGKGTCLWASENEEFPIAVTKKRIGE